MALAFPGSPTIGQIYTYSSRSWVWTGTTWDLLMGAETAAGGDLAGTYPNPTIAPSVALTTPDIGAATADSIVMSGRIDEYQAANIASAATTDIGAATGNYVNVTGTTTITALGTVQAGARRVVRFTGALTLTHNATSLILPGGANITTAANDVAQFISLGAGNWVCVDFTPASVTGTGATVRATSPTLVTPVLGDASASKLTMSGPVNEIKSSTTMAATATTMDIGAADGNVIYVSGTGVTITAFASTTVPIGTRRLLYFTQGPNTIGYQAFILATPGATSFTVDTGDLVEFLNIGPNSWRVMGMMKYDADTGTDGLVRATSPTIVTPNILDFTNANHDHSSVAEGGVILPSVLNASGTVSSDTFPTGGNTWVRRSKLHVGDAGATWSTSPNVATSIFSSSYTPTLFQFNAGDLAYASPIGDVFVIEGAFSYTNNSGADATLTFNFKFNATNGMNYTSPALATNANPRPVQFRIVGAVSSNTIIRFWQSLYIGGAVAATSSTVAAYTVMATQQLTTANISNAANTVDILVNSSTATATQTFTARGISIYKMAKD